MSRLTYLLAKIQTQNCIHLLTVVCEEDYRQYCVLVDNKDAQHTESDWFTIHTAQKYIYLHIYQVEKNLRCESFTDNVIKV